MAQAPATQEPARPGLMQQARSLLLKAEVDSRLLSMLVALIVIWIGFNLWSGGQFLQARNLWNLSVQTASRSEEHTF